MVVAFNPNYLIDGVEAIAGDEVQLETLDASSRRPWADRGLGLPVPADAGEGVLTPATCTSTASG